MLNIYLAVMMAGSTAPYMIEAHVDAGVQHNSTMPAWSEPTCRQWALDLRLAKALQLSRQQGLALMKGTTYYRCMESL